MKKVKKVVIKAKKKKVQRAKMEHVNRGKDRTLPIIRNEGGFS